MLLLFLLFRIDSYTHTFCWFCWPIHFHISPETGNCFLPILFGLYFAQFILHSILLVNVRQCAAAFFSFGVWPNVWVLSIVFQCFCLAALHYPAPTAHFRCRSSAADFQLRSDLRAESIKASFFQITLSHFFGGVRIHTHTLSLLSHYGMMDYDSISNVMCASMAAYVEMLFNLWKCVVQSRAAFVSSIHK